MKLELTSFTYKSIGGVPAVSAIPLYLTRFLSEIEPRELTVSLELCFRTPRPERGLLEL